VTLADVRRWVRARGISRDRVARAYRAAFLVAASRLLQGIYREDHAACAALYRDRAGRWRLDLGRRPVLRAPVSGLLPFRRLELTGLPAMIDAGRRRPLRTTRAFLNALRRCLEPSLIVRHFDRLAADFNNSFANLVLNRLLGQRLAAGARAIEPVFEGHHYYPFPALRIGPSLRQVVESSNLCREPIDLTLVAARPCVFVSAAYADHRACFRRWAGLRLARDADVVIPLHPWQLALSPVVRELRRRGWIAVLAERLQAVPLASQRTCRILATGFDVKLPIDATLTGEDRLLYPLNRANAPAFSLLARLLRQAGPDRSLDFQDDVAAVAHAEPSIGNHLSAIVRSPVPRRAGEVVVPALNLWCGPRQARALPTLRHRDQAYEFFRAYCRVLMGGPVDFYARRGMAFEPHLQNVYVALRDDMPSRIILRDLDSTILDPVRIRPFARANGVRLSDGTWRHMPDFATGGRRLAHAMLYGHLGEVMSYLARTGRADLARLTAAVDETWTELIAAAPSPSCRRRVRELRAQADTVGAVLQRRLTRAAGTVFIGAPRTPAAARLMPTRSPRARPAPARTARPSPGTSSSRG
jgi:siderophore synthetase component